MRLRPTDRLKGSLDAEAIFTSTPDTFSVKGMFFKRALDALGEDGGALRARSREPTKRYLPFRNYPQADHGLFACYAAIKAYPRVSQREALRRFSRADINDFSGSVLGRVTMSMVGDPIRALTLLPGVYRQVAQGPWGFSAETIEGKGDLVMKFERVTGDWSYQLGQIEGILDFYSSSGEIDVQPHDPGVTFTIYLDS